MLHQEGSFFIREEADKKLQHIAQLFTGNTQRMQLLIIGLCQELRPQSHHATASTPQAFTHYLNDGSRRLDSRGVRRRGLPQEGFPAAQDVGIGFRV